MERKKDSFTGSRPVFTGSPSIVPGGFNLDVENQNFNKGDIIPIGTVATFDEQTRKVQILKTAEVVDIDSDDAKIVSLKVAEFFAPVFCIGDKVAKADAISGTYATAAQITKITKTKSTYVITSIRLSLVWLRVTLWRRLSRMPLITLLKGLLVRQSPSRMWRLRSSRPPLTYALTLCNTLSWRGVCRRSQPLRKMPLAWL